MSITIQDAARNWGRGRTIDLGGRQVHFLDEGEGDPVVFVHGFLYYSLMFEEAVKHFSDRYRCLAIDLFGWGYSERLSVDYSYDIYANQVLGLLDALEIEQAHLVGQSMGGGTIIDLAAARPERVRSLTLIGAAGLPNPLPLTAKIFSLPGVAKALLGLAPEKVLARNLRQFWFHDSEWVTPAYVAEVARPFRLPGTTRTLSNILRHLDFGSLSEEIEELGKHELPTLIIWGQEDQAVPLALGRKMHEMLPGSRLEVIPEAAHSPHEERPEAAHPLMAEHWG